MKRQVIATQQWKPDKQIWQDYGVGYIDERSALFAQQLSEYEWGVPTRIVIQVR